MNKKHDEKKPKQVEKTAKSPSSYQAEKSGKEEIKNDDLHKHGKKK